MTTASCWDYEFDTFELLIASLLCCAFILPLSLRSFLITEHSQDVATRTTDMNAIILLMIFIPFTDLLFVSITYVSF